MCFPPLPFSKTTFALFLLNAVALHFGRSSAVSFELLPQLLVCKHQATPEANFCLFCLLLYLSFWIKPTDHVLLLSKKRTRNRCSLASWVICSPSFSTSKGGTGIGTPLWNTPSRGIFGSIICGANGSKRRVKRTCLE